MENYYKGVLKKGMVIELLEEIEYDDALLGEGTVLRKGTRGTIIDVNKDNIIVNFGVVCIELFNNEDTFVVVFERGKRYD